jgi:hypothetical protein
MPNETLLQKIKEVASPIWTALIKETPEIVTVEGMTFDDFCDEIRLTLDI